MGQIYQKLGISENKILDLSQHKIEIILSESEIAQLEEEDPSVNGLAVTVNAVALEAALPEAIVKAAGIICVEVNPQSVRSIARISQLRQERPDLPVIALVREADISLVRTLLRQGVNDVIELPLSIRQLTDSVGEILGRLAATPAHAPGKSGQLISVIKSMGGVGATNVAVNLATALGTERGGDTSCLFDLDVQFGNAATYLGVQSGSSLSDLLQGGDRVDGHFLRAVASTVAGGVSFVSAPSEFLPIEAIDLAQLRKILHTARGQFDYVVADFPANWANWTLAIAAESDVVILIVTLSVASLRQGKRQLQLLRSLGIDPSKILVLANRVEQRLFKTIGLDDAAKALGHPVSLSVHNDYPMMSAANNQGVVVGEFSKRSKIARDFVRIAQSIGELTEKAP